MNYYPYGYGMIQQPNPYMQNYQNIQPTQQQQTQQVLNGKIVDSQDVVKATEVPIGGYGIFPKADLSEIYIKSWNNNGTTNIITFKPAEEPVMEKIPIQEDSFSIIIERINQLESKLDNIIAPSTPEPVVKKKEVDTNAY